MLKKYDMEYYFTVTKGRSMAKKTTTTNLKKEIRKRYEYGEGLIDLAIEFKVNYGTLRNLASHEKWEKGIVRDIVRAKEIFEAADKTLKEREAIKEEYKLLTKDLRNYAIDKATGRKVLSGDKYTSPVSKSIEEAFLKRVTAIDVLYKLDKDLHSIYSDKELLEMKQETAKYEKLKKELDEKQHAKLLD